MHAILVCDESPIEQVIHSLFSPSPSSFPPHLPSLFPSIPHSPTSPSNIYFFYLLFIFFLSSYSVGMTHGFDSPAQGAATPVFLATSPTVENISGKYFVDCTERKCSFAGDTSSINELWDVASKLVVQAK